MNDIDMIFIIMTLVFFDKINILIANLFVLECT